jgi:hypothetical protein
MAIASTLVGARCKLFIDGQPVGLFANVSYSVEYGAQDIYTLGKYNAQEIVYTDMGTVNVRVSGFRVMEHGPYAEMSVPKLQELLGHDDIVLQIVDRQGAGDQQKENVVTVYNVRPLGYEFDTQARGVASLSASFRGITIKDESDVNPQSDTASAASYI